MSRSERMISSLFSARLVRAAVARGVSAAPLWHVLGIEITGDDTPPVSETRHLALWEHVIRTLDDPGFAITYAATMSIDDYGVLGLACKTAKNVREALQVLQRYIGAYADLITIGLDGDALTLTRPGPDTMGYRAAVESSLAEILGAMRQLAGTDVVPNAVTFAHRSPADISSYRVHFGLVPRFDAERHALVLSAQTLERPLRASDGALHRYLTGALDDLVATRMQREPTWAIRVRSEALRLIPNSLAIETIARSLGISARTLQRRLTGEATTFEIVLDEARRELADALLADPTRSVSEVATACGFAEASSFSRAYRRWTGTSPRGARRAHEPSAT